MFGIVTEIFRGAYSPVRFCFWWNSVTEEFSELSAISQYDTVIEIQVTLRVCLAPLDRRTNLKVLAACWINYKD